MDDYLEAIQVLVTPVGCRPTGGTIAARVADQLGVSRTAVGEMRKRLIADGLLEPGVGGTFVLTAAGTARAEGVVRRTRIVERFVTDFLGYGLAVSYTHATRIGGVLTDEMVERLHARLGFPGRCPHGWPVAPAEERQESAELVPLAELRQGDAGEIVRLAEHDAGLLTWLHAEGFVPGAQIEVCELQPAAGHRRLRFAESGKGERLIADQAARALFVRRSPPRP